MLGSQYSAADGYTLVFYGWGKRIGLPVEQLKNYTALKDRLLQRPAVQARCSNASRARCLQN